MIGITMTTSNNLAEWLLFIGATVFLLLFSVFTYMVIQKSMKFDEEHSAFMSKCIEFHTSRRCEEFWWYRRQDLGSRP